MLREQLEFAVDNSTVKGISENPLASADANVCPLGEFLEIGRTIGFAGVGALGVRPSAEQSSL